MSCIKIQIIRVEGENWDNSSLGCYVSLDNELVDVITPLNSQHESNTIKVPSKGYLKLFVKTMGDSSKFLGNITIPLEILPTKGYTWLPLVPSVTENFISSIPEPVLAPRILLGVSSELVPVVPLKEPESYETLVHQDLVMRIKELQTQLLQETTSRNSFQASYLNLVASNNKQLSNAQARETSLINLLEQKDEQIQKLKILMDKYENSKQSEIDEKKQLVQLLEHYKSQDLFGVIQRLSEELDETKKIFTASVKQRAYLCSSMKIADFQELDSNSMCYNDSDRNLLDLKAEIIQYDEENKSLRSKLSQNEKIRENLNSQVFELQQIIDNQIENESSCIDSMISALSLTSFFKKTPNCYLSNDKIVQIIKDNAKLLVKTDQDLVNIEEYVQQFACGSDRVSEYESHYKSGSVHNSSTRKIGGNKTGENRDLEKTSRKVTGSYCEIKSIRKVSERTLKDKNLRDVSLDRKRY
jgi:hypothetical protein